MSETSSNRRDELRVHLGESKSSWLLERLRDLRPEHEERKAKSEKDEDIVFCDRSMVVSEEVHLVWESEMGEEVMFEDFKVRT